ncbi:MAG: ATP-binding protein, partial [Bacteroidia bacterium]
MKENRTSNTKLVIMLSSMVSIVLVLFIAFTANRYIERMSVNNSELYSAFRISELMKLFRANILVLEAKQRGYIVTGDPKFLEEYKLRESETKTYLKGMEKYFSGKPEEETFYKLKDLTYKKLKEAKDLSHSNDGLPGAKADPSATINIMDEINTTISEINESLGATTKVLLENSVEYVNASRKWSYREIAIGILTALLVVMVLFRDINLRNQLQEELRIAKAKADQNALMKEQFMANMSHEIRTPMNAIVGFTDLLQKTTLDPAQRDYLSAIKTSGSNLLNIINDILDFSKIEAGKLQIEKIPFSLTSVIDPLKLIFTEKAKEKGIGFRVSTDSKIPALIFGDPTRLTQILVNLLGNAVKFTLKGEVSLSCEIKSIEHDVVQLVFRIKDSGIGIPSDKLDDVFERFNQGNAATTRKFGGTGLGLSIVKSLVEIQNGDIDVKSREGSGTEFIVTLSYPVSYENVSTIPQASGAELKISSEKPLRVLLAEDNPLNQKLATIYLNAFGL